MGNPKKGYANIVPDLAEIVEDVLYEINKSDLIKLDKFEGDSNHYNRIKLIVKVDDGQKVNAEVYVAQPEYIRKGLRSSRNYMKHLLAAKDIISSSYSESLKQIETLD